MPQTCTKRVQEQAWLGRKGDPLGIVHGIEIWAYYQMVYPETRINPRK